MATVTLRGQEWPLLFDLNAVEAVQERYGDVESLMDELGKAGETRWLLALLIREGVAARNDEEGLHDLPPTEEQVGRMVTLADLQSTATAQAILEAFAESTGKNMTGAELTALAQDLAKTAEELTASRPRKTTKKQSTSLG